MSGISDRSVTITTWFDMDPCLKYPISTDFKLGIDILYSVDYYLIINNLTARGKPMTDSLETYSEENLREIEAVEDYE